MSAVSDREWITYKEAGKRLQLQPKVIQRLVDSKQLTTQTIPGCRTRISAADVERFARENITPAVTSQTG